MPGRSRIRAFCTSGGAETTTTASTRRSPPVSNKSNLLALALRIGQKALLGLVHERMNDVLEPLQCRRVIDDSCGELDAVDYSPRGCSGKGCLNCGDRFALIEPVHDRVSIMHRDSRLGEKTGRGGFSHSKRTGQTKHEHSSRHKTFASQGMQQP